MHRMQCATVVKSQLPLFPNMRDDMLQDKGGRFRSLLKKKS